MQAKNIPVTYIVYPDEGHGFQKPENRLAYICITEAFFASHLGGAFELIGSDLAGQAIRFAQATLPCWILARFVERR